jgi:hypothetical protein
MDSHATRNMFKQKQDFIDGRLGIVIVSPSSLNSTKANCLSPALRLATPPSSNIGLLKRLMTKQEMLQFESRNLTTMASCFQMSSKICDALLAANMDINHYKNKVKISNLKATQELRVILKEEFKAHLRTCLHM